MDLRFAVRTLLLLILVSIIFTFQKSVLIVCQFAKRADGSLHFILTESALQVFENKANSSIVSFQHKEGLLEIKFLKSSIYERDFFSYFSTGSFLIPNQSEIQLPDGLLLPIKPGRYKIEESDLYYEVTFE
ncbi:MAG: hypothetical protein CFE21_11835 [Bacteroidetes bacterium B1(2017)]|nr:MAG: hypothetical protein CFE21_11835 [Bacteroidetes bacterium B1(2017)]